MKSHKKTELGEYRCSNTVLSWPKIVSCKALCGKAHCCDAISTCPTKDLVFFIDYITINVTNLESIMPDLTVFR